MSTRLNGPKLLSVTNDSVGSRTAAVRGGTKAAPTLRAAAVRERTLLLVTEKGTSHPIFIGHPGSKSIITKRIVFNNFIVHWIRKSLKKRKKTNFLSFLPLSSFLTFDTPKSSLLSPGIKDR